MAERDFFDVMKESLKTGLQTGRENFLPQIGAELSRLGKQGSLELAQALFNGAAFTPYGPGQYTPTPELDKAGQETGGQEVTPQPEQEHERGGREM